MLPQSNLFIFTKNKQTTFNVYSIIENSPLNNNIIHLFSHLFNKSFTMCLNKRVYIYLLLVLLTMHAVVA